MITNAIVWIAKKIHNKNKLANDVKMLKAILQVTVSIRDNMHDNLEAQVVEWLECNDTIDTEIVYNRVKEIIGR